MDNNVLTNATMYVKICPVLRYATYCGSVEWSEEDKIYHGKILFIRDLITYDGKTMKELSDDFRTVVEMYVNKVDSPNVPRETIPGGVNIYQALDGEGHINARF
jgi:predicted HicB family RNase H-like nuclease